MSYDVTVRDSISKYLSEYQEFFEKFKKWSKEYKSGPSISKYLSEYQELKSGPSIYQKCPSEYQEFWKI